MNVKSIALTIVLLVAVLLTPAFGQNDERRIGSIDFFGYAGLNLDKVKQALPIRVGDTYPGPIEIREQINKAVVSAIGRAPTDVSPVCCNAQGNYTIFVGLPGSSVIPIKFNPVPTGNTHFPPEIVNLYTETMDAVSSSVLKGNTREDTSKGYALSINDQSLRGKQQAVRAYAIRHEELIRDVLASAHEDKQRVVASYLLGYVRQSNSQIAGLAQATHDANEDVRNNAARALAVLAASSSKVAARIPADGFIKMLNSGTWSDRNKAGWVLSSLTGSRDPKLLARMRSQALTSLIEMSQWQDTGHAQTSRILLGRIARIPERRLLELVNAETADEIIKALSINP